MKGRMQAGVVAALLACGARTELGAPPLGDAGKDGASVDGSLVDASLPSPCLATAPTMLASGGKEIQFLGLDHDSVYWTDFALGTVSAAPKAGGASRLVAAGQGNPSGIVVIGADAYWTEWSGDAVVRAPAAGGGAVTTVASGQDGAYDITAASGTAYWTTLRGCSVARAEGDKVHVIAVAKQPFTSIVSTDSLVFWVSFEKKVVERYEVASGTRSVLMTSNDFDLPAALATDGARVYFAGPSATQIAIGAVSVDGSDPHPLYSADCGDAGAARCVGDLATDGAFVYFTAAREVLRVPIDGGDAETIATDQARPFAVAVDDRCVYWSNLGDGTVWAAPTK